MTRARRASLLLAVAVAVGCGDRTLPPNGELLVYVDTDAPLDFAPGDRLTPDRPAPLFDRLRVEVLHEDGTSACEACSNDFSVNRDQLARGALSFGVHPPAGAKDLVVRARLSRGSRERGGVPAPDATIDRAMRLPAIGAEGIVEVTVPLMLETVGTVADLSSLDPAVPGKVVRATLHPGVPPAPCSTPGGEGQVCVPSGAFWMSDPTILSNTKGDQPASRVAIVSPFWLDAGEVTVGQLRGSGLASASDPKRNAGVVGECTYTDAAGPNEALPVSCISFALAERYCESKQGRLPTEAQFEFVAGGRNSQRYPWGAEDPACGDAVFARVDVVSAQANLGVQAVCSSVGVGPAARGAGLRDALSLTGGTIFDVAGNLAEWTLDAWQAFGQSCWGAGLAIDPLCESSPDAPRAVRGGGWTYIAFHSRSTAREPLAPTKLSSAVGFRCARPGR